MISSSAYINEKLFSYWIKKILVLKVQARQKALELLNKASALLILDGCLAYNEKLFQSLSNHYIDFYFLVPHSSHII